MPAYIGENEIDTIRLCDKPYEDEFSILATYLWPEGATPETHTPSIVIDANVVYTMENSGRWWSCGEIVELSPGKWQAWHHMVGYGCNPRSDRGIHAAEERAAWACL